MSRSVKEPIGQAVPGKKYLVKRQANKVVRRKADVPSGKAYRKYFESWDLCDYTIRNWDSSRRAPETRSKKERLSSMVVRGRKLVIEPIMETVYCDMSLINGKE